MKINLAHQPFNIKLLCALLSLLAIGYLVILGKEILSPFIFACLFSILLLPLARFLETRWGFRRNLAAFTAVIVMIACISGLFYFLGAQLSRLSGDWPLFKEQLNSSVASLQEWIATKFHVDAVKQINYVKDATSKIVDTGTVVAGATLLSVSSVMIFLVFSLIYTFFFFALSRIDHAFFGKGFPGRKCQTGEGYY